MKPVEIDAGMHNIEEHEGWFGAFTTDHVAGAYENDTVVVKVNSQEGDAHANGSKGRVLGSFIDESAPDVTFYFIEWFDRPRVAVGTIGFKVVKDAI